MKLISFAIPSYNSQGYMDHAIETLLTGGDDVEIIIVNDGSKDNTGKIADEYAAKYPNIVKAVHQENGGHGEAVNTGLKHATGMYYKVIDSDDWVDEEALKKVIATLKELSKENLDLMIVNYVYEKVNLGKQKPIDYKSALPVGEIFTWDDIKHFRIYQYILMHSAIYRTQLLRDCGLELPKHTFYVDNIFVYQPLPYVKSIYYLDVDFYRYFIGRDDQSVNEEVMKRRIDQQIRVTKIIIDSHDVMKLESKKLRDYMVNYVAMMMTISSVFLIKIDTDESIAKKDELWDYLKNSNEELYKKVKGGLLGSTLHLKGKPGKVIIEGAYKAAQKIFGFN
ncbi:MAG: glycosyltransferase family 2 protein [Clostridiales bacterium]|nr:glycosyltransferase family 2 protein [Clostridiales bacterium]